MYVAFTVVVDLDREVLTVNDDIHYDLFDIPENWRDDVDDEDVWRTSQMKFAYEPPETDPDLLALYDSSEITIDDTRRARRPTDIRYAIMNEMMKNYMDTYRYPFLHFGHEWCPSDIQFRKLVYALVKLASWKQLGIQSVHRSQWYALDEEHDLGDFLLGCQVPSSETYCVLGGEGEVLIHLDTDFKNGIGRVIQFAKECRKSRTTACIISLSHVMAVTVTINKEMVSVKHTSPISLNETAGRDILIDALDTQDFLQSNFYSLSANLPVEIIAKIFECLCFIPGGIKTISAWRQVCKGFNNLAETHVVTLPDLTILDFVGLDNHEMYHAVDSDGNVGIWTRSYPFSGMKRELRWRAMPKGSPYASYGCGILTLWEIDPKLDDINEDN